MPEHEFTLEDLMEGMRIAHMPIPESWNGEEYTGFIVGVWYDGHFMALEHGPQPLFHPDDHSLS